MSGKGNGEQQPGGPVQSFFDNPVIVKLIADAAKHIEEDDQHRKEKEEAKLNDKIDKKTKTNKRENPH